MGISFTYDSVGNVANDGIHTYSYDFQGRPITVDGISVIYDAFGRVAEENNAGTVTQILYQPDGSKFATMHGHSSLVNYFVPMAGGMVEVFNASGVQYVRHADWLGSSRLGTTPAQTAVYDRAYAPYGEPYGETATTDRSFTGQTQDTKSDGLNGTTGLYDFLYRQNSPAQRRWLVPDPAGLSAVDITNPQTWNRYAYVGNNPLSNVDPLGLQDSSTTTCDGDHCKNVTNVDVTDTIIVTGWWDLAYEGWPGTGSAQSFFCMLMGGCSGGGSSTGSGGGGQAQPKRPASSNAPNSTLSTIQRIYNSGCVGSALKGNAPSLSLDVLGVTLAASPLGPEAKIVGAIALGVTSTVVGATDANSATAKGRLATLGAVANIFGIQTAPLELAKEFAQFSKGAGKVLTGVGVGADLATVGVDIKTCLSQQR